MPKKKLKYGMVIDLKRCIGCDTCTVACRAENATSKGVLFNRVHKFEVGKYPYSKFQAPNSKSQINPKLQFQITEDNFFPSPQGDQFISASVIGGMRRATPVAIRLIFMNMKES